MPESPTPSPLDALKRIDAQQASDERLYAELTSAIPEALPDAIVVIDRAGTIRLINQRTELLFGYSRKELLGQKVEISCARSMTTRSAP